MINYIKELTLKLQTIKNQLTTEMDEFKLIDLRIELANLESKMNYCVEQVFINYSDKNILDFAKNYISIENINAAEKKASEVNITTLNRIIKQGYNPKEQLENELNELLHNNPNIENDEFSETPQHKKAKRLRKEINSLNQYIETNKKKVNYFYNYLNNSDKISLVENMLVNFNDGKESEEELLKRINEYTPPLNLLYNATYPLKERYEQLTNNVDNNLSKYLKENKDTIDRLTLYSDHDTTVKYFDKKVLKTEYRITELRHQEFNKCAKDAKIDDITSDRGQFDSNKIYYNKEHHKRYLNCIKELQTTDETKSNIKELLHELDSLNILDDNANASESANKIYGFTKFFNIRKQFVDAINEEPANEEKIKKTLEALKEEEAKINKMYELIKEKLGDDYDTMPSNVDSFRNYAVPPCFKNNLSLNAKFNSLFITLTFIKEKGLTIDEFVDNPVKCSSKAYEKQFNNNNIDSKLKGKSKAEALLYLSDTSKQPALEDPFKYTRSFEIIAKNEKNEEYTTNNVLSTIALGTYNGTLNRSLSIGIEYFAGNSSETIQNILMAKKNGEGNISYLDCYVPTSSIHENLKTGLAIDEKSTIIEKIQADENIEQTFYNAINTLKDFTLERKNARKSNNINLESNEVYQAVQELALKIIFACDLKGKPIDQKRGYSAKFVEDVFNAIVDYTQFDELKDFNFKSDDRRINKMINVIKYKDLSVKEIEKTIKESQTVKEELFIKEFERLNKEIDDLDKQADKISKKIGQGKTNQDIENIAAEQQRKFIDIKKLQNRRLEELRNDVGKGIISKYYFEKRAEQIKLLDNVKEIPAFFEFEEKCYKDYKTFTKEVLKINPKKLTSLELRAKKEQYNIIVNQMKEEKRLFFINKMLEKNGLSINKPINHKKVENIVFEENIAEMENISKELLNENLKYDKVQLDNSNQSLSNDREHIDVDLNENQSLINEDFIKETKKENIIKKDVMQN